MPAAAGRSRRPGGLQARAIPRSPPARFGWTPWGNVARVLVDSRDRQEVVDVHHQDVVVPSFRAAWPGRHAGAAAPRCHGAGPHAHGEDRGGSGTPLRRGVRPHGRTPQPLDAHDDRGGLRVQSHPQAARAVPGHLDRGDQRRSAAAGHTLGQLRHVAHGQRAEAHRSRGLLRRHFYRSTDCQADRGRHGPSLLRARYRGFLRIHRGLRYGLQLRLHELAVVEVPHAAAAGRNQPARGLRAHVRSSGLARRARTADAAEPQHPGLGGRGCRLARKRAGCSGPGAPRSGL